VRQQWANLTSFLDVTTAFEQFLASRTFDFPKLYLAFFTLGQSLIEWDNRQRVELSLRLIEAALAGNSLRPVEAECSTFNPWNGYALRGHLYGTIALFLTEEGNIDEAIEWRERAITSYEEAIIWKDDEAWVYQGKGVSEASLAGLLDTANKSEEAREYRQRAIDSYTRSLDIDPHWENETLYLNRADVYSELNEDDLALADFDQAFELYDQVIELDPESVSSYVGRGLAYMGLGEDDLALADFEQALELGPDNFTALRNIASVLTDKGHIAETIPYYDQMIRLDPDFAVGYLGRGSAYYAKGEYTQAIEDFSYVLRMNDILISGTEHFIGMVGYRPESIHVAAYSARGLCYDQLGDTERAVTDYSTAIDLEPNFPFPYFNRSFAYAKTGDVEAAIEDIEVFLGIYDGPEAQASIRTQAEVHLETLRNGAE
jgi:tetratricopeptide (TPR) repeat protein